MLTRPTDAHSPTHVSARRPHHFLVQVNKHTFQHDSGFGDGVLSDDPSLLQLRLPLPELLARIRGVQQRLVYDEEAEGVDATEL